jgi:tetratricopeptide (TPR) repeat protein
LKIAIRFGTAALLLASARPALPQTTAQAAAPPASQNSAKPATAKRGPQAKSKAELDAYQSAATQTDPAKLEAAATEFAQRYPASELRPFLFQRAMGLYAQANNPGKTLEMARAELKYDPSSPVALLTAAQMLVAGTHDSDLDRDARLEEAVADARGAVQHAGEMVQPASFTAKQFADTIAQLRGAAHEAIATVAYKKRDYFGAIREYDAAVADEKEHADAVVWLRLAVAHDKVSEYERGLAAAEKAIAASETASPVRGLAEQEKARLVELITGKPAQDQSGNPPAPVSDEGGHAN